MDAYQPPAQSMRPPPPTDPYHQYYQQQARPPVPPSTQPGGPPPAWYPNQFHNPHSPSPPPPPQWGPPSSHYPQGQPYPSSAYPPHQPPFNAGANGNGPFPPPPPPAGSQIPPPYSQANQEWGNPNWGYQQGHNSQANSNVEDWAVKAKEWAAATKDQQSQSAPNQPSGQQVYQQQYSTHGYQDVHQQAVQGVSYQQQFPAPPTTQPEGYPNYSTANESYPGGSFAGFSHQENLPTSSAIHQQEVPYSYSSVAGKKESGNTTQHEVQISVPDGGGPVHAGHHMQYAYGDQTPAQPSNLSDQPVQFGTRESSDYASVHNAWQPHAATGVVYSPIPSSVPSIPQHDSAMAIPSVSGHTMPPYGSFPPPNLQPVVPPYAFGTKPPLHPVAFMDDSYAASSVPPKKAPVPNWLKDELLKKKADLGRPSSGSLEERESMDDDLPYKPPAKADQRDEKSFSPSKSSDEEEDDEDEMDAERTTAINMEIKRILTEVLLKVTDELFDEIATKVINEDQPVSKDDSVQHNKSSSSLLSTADSLHKASANILVSVEGANKKASSGSPADVLGLASYASDDDDADTDAASNADADENDGVESLGVVSRHDGSQQPSTEKLPEPEEMANTKLDLEVEVNANSGKNSKSDLEDYSQMLGSRRKDDEAGSIKISDVSASSGLDDTSGSKKKHPDRTDSDKDAIVDEPRRKNSGLKSDCNLHQDNNKTYGKDLRDDLSKDGSRTDETNSGKEKVDSQNGSKDRMKQGDIKSAEKVKCVEPSKKSTDTHVKKDSREVERPHRTNSKEDRGKKREKEKEEERSRHRRAGDSSKDKRRRSPTSNGSSDDSTRKSRSRRRNVSPSPVRSRRKRSSPSSDESSDDTRRKSSSRRRNRSPSPGKSRRRQVSSRSPHSKHSQHKPTLYSSHNKSRSKRSRSRSRSRSPHRRHRAK